MSKPNPDAQPPAIYRKLKPAELEALEELYRCELATAMERKPVLPDHAKLPVKVRRPLAAMGLIKQVELKLPPPPGCIPVPTTVKEWVLTPHGHLAYCEWAATFDYDDDGNRLGPKADPEAVAA